MTRRPLNARARRELGDGTGDTVASGSAAPTLKALCGQTDGVSNWGGGGPRCTA